MIYDVIKLNCTLLLLGCSIPLLSQQTFKGMSIGIAGTTNFTTVAKYELSHPVRMEKVKLPPDEVDEEIKIQNPIDHNKVATFSGKQTIINMGVAPNNPQGIEEFPCVNFRALDDDGTSIPPDVGGAIGFDHLMVTLNTQVRMQNKQGDSLGTTSLIGFWNGLGGHNDIFDPKITYDPYDKRWFFVCCASRKSARSALLLGVSQTFDPTGWWNTYTIDAESTDSLWFDYPSLGFNRNWIAVSGNMFSIANPLAFRTGRVWIINKSDVYSGIGNIYVPFFDRSDYSIICPAVTYDPNDNTLWCASVHNANSNNSGFVRLFTFTGTGASPIFRLDSVVNVGASWNSGGVNGPQLGSGTGLDLGDDRILQSTFRNGTLWISNNVFLPATNSTTCAAQIVSINVSNRTATENIKTTVDNTGATMNAYPSITVNQNNDIFFGCSTFRTSTYVTSTVLFRRSGQGFFYYYYKGGEDWYVKVGTGTKNRWGDYSSTFIDPEDDITAWTVQEYARPRNAGTSFWGTWWAKICPGGCINDATVTGTYGSNFMKKWETNNSITSTATFLNGCRVKLDAGNIIILSPGFSAAPGSSVQIYNDGCGGNR